MVTTDVKIQTEQPIKPRGSRNCETHGHKKSLLSDQSGIGQLLSVKESPQVSVTALCPQHKREDQETLSCPPQPGPDLTQLFRNGTFELLP